MELFEDLRFRSGPVGVFDVRDPGEKERFGQRRNLFIYPSQGVSNGVSTKFFFPTDHFI